MYRPFYGETKLALLDLIQKAENDLISMEQLAASIFEIVARDGSRVDEPRQSLSQDLAVLNALLPWSSRNDYRGLELGTPYSATKRSAVQKIPSSRVLALHSHLSLEGRVVADVGCYEGIDAVSLVHCGARVLGLDFQIENIVKALVLAWYFGASESVKFALCDIDKRQLIPTLAGLRTNRVDLVFASGLLYHLASPEKFLAECAEVADSVYVSTQLFDVKSESDVTETDVLSLKGRRIAEPSSGPFRGASSFGLWPTRHSLFEAAMQVGLRHVEIISETVERNGPRIDVLFRRRVVRTSTPLNLESRIAHLNQMDSGSESGLVVRIGENPSQKIFVVGPAKSGTSLLVKIVEELGYWNPAEVSSVGELDINNPRDLETHMYSLFAFLDRCEQPCVVKSPKMIDPSIIDDFVGRLENSPNITVVLVSRDVLKIAHRRSIEGGDYENLLADNFETVSKNSSTLHKILRTQNPKILVSGDDLLLNPQTVAMKLAEALEVPPVQDLARLVRNALSWRERYIEKHGDVDVEHWS